MPTPYPLEPVLMVDDEENWLRSFRTVLGLSGVTNVETCTDSRRLLELLASKRYCLLLMDIVMPFLPGDKLLPQVAERHPDLPVIMLSGLDQVETAVQCIKQGAWDYFVKTTESSTLVAAVRRAIQLSEARAENRRLRTAMRGVGPGSPSAFEGMVTADPKMLAAFRYMESVAGTGLPVLITGETGVGKELAARALHSLSGRSGPFVPVNMAGLDDNTVTDTLFGHRKGAFTDAAEARQGLVARAAKGTLFLDEIGDLSPTSQIKLLRLLQENEYLPLGSDVPVLSEARVVAATQADLESLLDAGTFRPDLYYRLSSHQVRLPPLRERKGDLPLLLEHFLEQASAELGKTRPPVPQETVDRLSDHSFPGNVRELRSMVWDAMAGYERGWLGLKAPGQTEQRPASPVLSENLFENLEKLPTSQECYAMLVHEALRRFDGNRTRAAEVLGVSRQALARHLKKDQ